MRMIFFLPVPTNKDAGDLRPQGSAGLQPGENATSTRGFSLWVSLSG
jgi:hypothetical protein